MLLMNSFCLKLIKAMFMVCLVFQVEQLVSAKHQIRCIQRERQALLQFKAALVDPYDMLSSWTTDDCCEWKGIRCSNLTRHIFMLDLHGEFNEYDYYDSDFDWQHVSGKIHESLTELQQLKYLNLSGNYFQNSHIPDFIGSLSNLRYLDLSNSQFGGKIPNQFGSLSQLKYLNLAWNSLEGSIPYQLGKLSKLRYLDLGGNSLQGNIPSQLGNLLKLQELYLGGYFGDLKIENGNHGEGQWLSNLTSLIHLHLGYMSNLNSSHCWLQMIGNLSKLRELSLYDCSLSDDFILSLKSSKFNFSTSLSICDLSWNTFTPSLVLEWVSNVTSNLVELDLSRNLLKNSASNHFVIKLVKLPKLRKLRLVGCNLSDNFLRSLNPSKFNFSTSLSFLDLSWNTFTSSMIIFHWVSHISSNLIELDLSHNLLTNPPSNHLGTVMNSLKWLDLSYNNLQGSMSDHFGIMMNSLERLDLSSNSFKGGVLKSFTDICTLRSLIINENRLTGDLPSILHNLFSGCVRYSLQELELRSNQITGSLPDLSIFPSLKAFHLSGNQLSGKIPESSRLSSQLEYLSLDSNSLEGGIPKSFGSACTLRLLDLSNNNLTEELPVIIHHLSRCTRHSLQELYLDTNRINGTLPNLSKFSTLKSLFLQNNQVSGKIPNDSMLPSQLETLWISSNFLEGGVPKSFGSACTLRVLDLSYNNLNEELPVIMDHLSGCARYSLQELDFRANKINGTLPDLSVFSSLKRLSLDENRLNGTISKNIRFPTQLEELGISSNSLEGVITDSHFVNMSNLMSLELSDNSLTLAFTQEWIPPFQLDYISLRSCNLGPTFPIWLLTQNNFDYLDISNAQISDIVPERFWHNLALPEVTEMNISYNNLRGIIPNVPIKNPFFYLTLASNRFEGPIPPFLRGSIFLDLSKNKFSDSLSFLCANGATETLYQLDLSNNQLSGQIPDCWSHFKSLAYLDLSHNKFSGKIPTSMGSLFELQTLLLRNNNLTEEIPFSIRNCTKLVMLDMAQNRLSGIIPTWIGNKLQVLQILSLGRNHLFGSLPLQICYLKKLQLLDLSVNNLSGQIPKCINNFTSMAHKISSIDNQHHRYFVNVSYFSGNQSYDLNEFLMWKGSEQMFKNIELSLLKSIDLSSNNFSEEIPIEIEKLFELVSLNLSRNNLSGTIPSNIGKLTSLEFLDLSRNQLVGSIPSSLTQIDRLSMLDLSHNHLSGKIPSSTQLQSFNASSYEDNADLCGLPLTKLCIDGEGTQEPIEDEDLFFTHEFYLSMTIGFVISFWGVFGSILLKRSWRYAYFKLINNLTDTIYVMVALKVLRYKWRHT